MQERTRNKAFNCFQLCALSKLHRKSLFFLNCHGIVFITKSDFSAYTLCVGAMNKKKRSERQAMPWAKIIAMKLKIKSLPVELTRSDSNSSTILMIFSIQSLLLVLDCHTMMRHMMSLMRMMWMSGVKWNLLDFSRVRFERASTSEIYMKKIKI